MQVALSQLDTWRALPAFKQYEKFFIGMQSLSSPLVSQTSKFVVVLRELMFFFFANKYCICCSQFGVVEFESLLVHTLAPIAPYLEATVQQRKD